MFPQENCFRKEYIISDNWSITPVPLGPPIISILITARDIYVFFKKVYNVVQGGTIVLAHKWANQNQDILLTYVDAYNCTD